MVLLIFQKISQFFQRSSTEDLVDYLGSFPSNESDAKPDSRNDVFSDSVTDASGTLVEWAGEKGSRRRRGTVWRG